MAINFQSDANYPRRKTVSVKRHYMTHHRDNPDQPVAVITRKPFADGSVWHIEMKEWCEFYDRSFPDRMYLHAQDAADWCEAILPGQVVEWRVERNSHVAEPISAILNDFSKGVV